MRVREVGEEDLAAVARLHLDTALAAYAHIFPEAAPKPPLSEMEARWKRIVAEGIGWLAEMDGRLSGVAGLVPDANGGFLEAVYVDPASWGRRVGATLVDRAEAEAVRRGWLPLRLWVLERNERARAWYERRGWQADGRRRTVWGPIDDVGYVLGDAAVRLRNSGL